MTYAIRSDMMRKINRNNAVFSAKQLARKAIAAAKFVGGVILLGAFMYGALLAPHIINLISE